jgi:hypothetical protein
MSVVENYTEAGLRKGFNKSSVRSEDVSLLRSAGQNVMARQNSGYLPNQPQSGASSPESFAYGKIGDVGLTPIVLNGGYSPQPLQVGTHQLKARDKF